MIASAEGRNRAYYRSKWGRVVVRGRKTWSTAEVLHLEGGIKAAVATSENFYTNKRVSFHEGESSFAIQ